MYLMLPAFLILLACLTIFPEQLAIKNFSISEGLARNQVATVYADSRGFVWFGTAGGLSRFDGYDFTNYTTRHGLPNPVITGIAEAESGVFWVATHGGLRLIDFNRPLNEEGRLEMESVALGGATDSIVFSIFQNERKILWAGTRDGLFKVSRNELGIQSEKITLGNDYLPRREGVGNLIEDLNGNLWVSNPDGLFRVDGSGEVTAYGSVFGKYFDRLGSIALDGAGRLWIGGLDGLHVLKPAAGNEELKRIETAKNRIELPANDGEFAFFDEKNGLADKRALEIFRSSDNRMWIATRMGASVFDGEAFQTLTTKNGLVSDEILCFGEDQAGNVWLGTESTGAMRAARSGFTSFTNADGLPGNRIVSVFEGSDGILYAVDGDRNVGRFDGKKFVPVKPRFPAGITETGWSWQQPVLQDSRGEWWIATAQGVLRYPKFGKIDELPETAPSAVYDSTDGLAGNQVFRLFEDGRGDVWISNFSPPASGIARFERATGKIHNVPVVSTRSGEAVSAYSYAEDKYGNLWLGLTDGRLARYRDGIIRSIENAENQPATTVYDIMPDAKGNLWLATGAGAYYMEDTAAETPRFTPLTAENGLTTDDVIAIAADLQGRIYFATSQGVNRYDPETKRIESFTTADGLANSEIRSARRDRRGNLWFGTIRGLTKFEPAKLNRSDSPPPILIRSVRAGADFVPLGELGAERVSEIELPPNQNHLEIEVLGLSRQNGDVLLYQYKLAEGGDWSEPTVQRKFTFVNLQPGNYRFEVRVVNSAGSISLHPASVSFTAIAPFYRRWWFIVAAALTFCGVVYLLYQGRVRRLLELEKIRHSIATDLHDDIGSSLSHISLVSEVLMLKGKDRDEDDKEFLRTIAEASREAVGAMSEMVWAINPRRDNLPDTIQRMRHFAGEILTSAGIAFKFQAPPLDGSDKIDVDTRRHLYLIFKEIINNAVRHSGATEMSVEIVKSEKSLILKIVDNGRGFDLSEPRPGDGLASMKERAAKIGGKLDVVSDTGKGTSVVAEIPRRAGVLNKIAT